MTGCYACDYYILRRWFPLLEAHLRGTHQLDDAQAGMLAAHAVQGHWVRYHMAADRTILGWEYAFSPP